MGNNVVSIVKKKPRVVRMEPSPFAGLDLPGGSQAHDPRVVDAPVRMGLGMKIACTAFWLLFGWAALSGYFSPEPGQDHAATVSIDDYGRH